MTDGAFFTAALDVAGDPSASAVARVFAIRALLYTGDPSQLITYGDLVAPRDQHGLSQALCASDVVEADRGKPTLGAPLPSDYRAQMTQLGERIVTDTAVAGAVRSAAGCLLH